MRPPNSQILTVAEMQAAEQALVVAGTSVDKLMQRAGRGAAEWVWRIAAGRSVTVLCGPGNNGGDGYVIAEVLRERGLPVTVIAPLAPRTSAAQQARSLFAGEVRSDGEGVRGGVLVDCLFGSGLSRVLDAEFTQLLNGLAASHDYRIAVDLPSGIDSDSGALLASEPPRYDLTLALGAWKFAHWTMPAMAQMGHRKLVSIGIDKVRGAAQLVQSPFLAAPAADAHKITRGMVAVIGGAMPGAALLSCAAAQRAGAGYVRLLPEAGDVTPPPDLVIDKAPLVDALADRRIAAILIGPGLGRDDAARARLERALACGKPLVLDADALHLLRPEMLAADVPIVATPHAGEFAALCEAFGIAEGPRDARIAALARASGMVVLAKGPDNRIAGPDGRLALAAAAPSWLSVAGSGDVLAGIAASRLATGVPPFEAACEAVWLHGEAARQAGAAFTASELAARVSAAYAAAL